MTADFGGPDARTTIAIMMSTSLDGITFTPYAAIPTGPVTAQYYSFQAQVSNAYVDPELNLGVLAFYI